MRRNFEQEMDKPYTHTLVSGNRSGEMPKTQLYDASFEFVRETERAICVTEDGGKTEIWLPKSQIEYDILRDGSVEVTMPVWLATEKKLV
jgi:hypothetical protein